jgi:hypothetical protein
VYRTALLEAAHRASLTSIIHEPADSGSAGPPKVPAW